MKYFLLVIALSLALTNAKAQFGMKKEKIRINHITDTLVKIDNQNILIRFDGWASGIVRVKIKVYVKYSNQDDDWTLICEYFTNTTKVSIALDQGLRELVFKSKSGMTILTLGFDGLIFKSDW